MIKLSILIFLVSFCVGCQPITAEGNRATHRPTALFASTATTLTLTTILTLTEPVDSPPAASDERLAYGRELYRKQYCGLCHQSTAAGTNGIFGPSHDGIGALAAQRVADSTYQGNATTAEAYLYESLIDPQRYTVPGYELTPHRMPVYTFLSTQDLDALVQFLLHQ